MVAEEDAVTFNAFLQPPDVVLCPELAFLIEAARSAAWMSHCNVTGLRYVERRDAVARLRGALWAYDERRRASQDVVTPPDNGQCYPTQYPEAHS